jgi:hypothetical protein
MLRSSPIFKRNGANLVEKKMFYLKKIRTAHFWGLNASNMQVHFLFVSSFEHVNFVIDGKYSKKNYDNLNYYASNFICDFSNIQNYSYKECPFTWVAPLIMFLPIYGWLWWNLKL